MHPMRKNHQQQTPLRTFLLAILDATAELIINFRLSLSNDGVQWEIVGDEDDEGDIMLRHDPSASDEKVDVDDHHASWSGTQEDAIESLTDHQAPEWERLNNKVQTSFKETNPLIERTECLLTTKVPTVVIYDNDDHFASAAVTTTTTTITDNEAIATPSDDVLCAIESPAIALVGDPVIARTVDGKFSYFSDRSPEAACAS